MLIGIHSSEINQHIIFLTILFIGVNKILFKLAQATLIFLVNIILLNYL
jgi:hypothetical protein